MRIRLMTYNIKSGRFHAEGLEAVASVIASQSPDILALQEVDDGVARSGRAAQTDWLARRLGMRGIFAPAMPYDGGQYGIALLSRQPILMHERRLLYRPEYSDTERPRHDDEQRVMLGTVIDVGEQSDSGLRVLVTHLGLTPDQRSVQVRELAAFARRWQADCPAIILGDFNCDPGAPELAPLRSDFQDACEFCGMHGPSRLTFPSGPLGSRCDDGWAGAIDHVWSAPGVNLVSASVVPDESRASDHQPLVVECEL